MPRIVFTKNLQRHVSCPPAHATGRTVGEALAAVFVANPAARPYVLDEHGAVRKHVVIFVNGQQIDDREKLTDPIKDDAEIYVMQALSGGQW